MSTESSFHKKLDVLESILGIKLEGNKVSERFVSLNKATRDPFISEKTEAYARFSKEAVIMDACEVKTETYGVDIKPFVVDLIFAYLITGMAHIFPSNNIPKVHHWLPVTYISPFGVKGNGKIRATVDGVAFLPGNTVDVTVKDVQFAHDRNKGYDLALEFFFGQIEDLYSNYRTSFDNSMFPVSNAVFFVAQSVRNPHPKTGFSGKTITKVVDALISSIDSMDSMYGCLGSVMYRLPISPYTPVRARKLADGTKVFVLPILPSRSFTLSDKPITEEVAKKATVDYRTRIITEAQREKGMVFGVSSAGVDAIINNC